MSFSSLSQRARVAIDGTLAPSGILSLRHLFNFLGPQLGCSFRSCRRRLRHWAS